MPRWLRWHLAKMRLTRPRLPPRHIRLSQHKNDARLEDLPPNAQGYERFAALWDDYAGWFVPEYGRFLAAAADHHAVHIESVLDLACGTGLVTRELAAHFAAVVGLDASDAMLHEARSRSLNPGLRFVRGDFRNFSLDRTFQAVACGSDSLNYLDNPDELAAVFHGVARHLSPAGFFVFDALDHRFLRRRARHSIAVEMKDLRFEGYFFYDVQARVGESRLVIGETIERHRRVPIETQDVARAAAAAGLTLAEHFSYRTYSPLSLDPARQFYLLRK